MSESLHVPDLAMIAKVYAEADKAPEMTVRIPRGASAEIPAAGDTVTLHTCARFGGKPIAECEGEVVAVAVVVRPDWSTLRNPRAESDQGSLL